MSESAPLESPPLTHASAGPVVVARGGLALAVMAAGIVVVATHGSSPIAKATTLLSDAKDASVVSASGVTRPAQVGESITPGEVVMTGDHGYADLLTRGRNVLLGSDAALAVVDGEHQQLRTGTAVVDARGGVGLTLDLAGDTVTVPGGSATEAARGVSVRVGALSGPASVTSTSGRDLTVTELSQAVLNGDALPSVTTPLHLTDSREESAVVPRLVADDLALKALARGIDTTGRSTAQIVEASWTGVRQSIPDSHSRSERVLPVLIADSTHGGSTQQRYDDAVAWRAEGGSWGVVLHLLNGRASAVESTLAALQRTGQQAGQVGQVVTQPVGAVTRGGKPGGSSTLVTEPIGGGTVPPTSPSHPGTPTPPTQPPNLVGNLVNTLQSVIDGVLNLLPHDATSTTASTAPATSTHASSATSTSSGAKSVTKSSRAVAKQQGTPTPTPTATSNGLLGDLLGGLLGKH